MTSKSTKSPATVEERPQSNQLQAAAVAVAQIILEHYLEESKSDRKAA
ncbi:MAG: hypothetical protein AAF604_04840 [Acidobacteriota bacterium]